MKPALTLENGENETMDPNNCSKTRLDQALLGFLLTCLVAFNVLVNPHFLLFVRLLNKSYEAPSPFIMSNRILDETYAKTMSVIRQELARTRGLSVTLDPWTCKAQGYPYLGISILKLFPRL